MPRKDTRIADPVAVVKEDLASLPNLIKAGSNLLVLRGPGDAGDGRRQRREGEKEFARDNIPDLDEPIASTRGKSFAIATERQGAHTGRVLAQGSGRLATGRFPQADLAILGGGEEAASRTVAERSDGPSVVAEEVTLLEKLELFVATEEGVQVGQLDDANEVVFASRGKHEVVGAEGNSMDWSLVRRDQELLFIELVFVAHLNGPIAQTSRDPLSITRITKTQHLGRKSANVFPRDVSAEKIEPFPAAEGLGTVFFQQFAGSAEVVALDFAVGQSDEIEIPKAFDAIERLFGLFLQVRSSRRGERASPRRGQPPVAHWLLPIVLDMIG